MNYFIAFAIFGAIMVFIWWQTKKAHREPKKLDFTPNFNAYLTDDEITLLKLINNYRDGKGLPILMSEKMHSTVANMRTSYFVDVGEVSHVLFYKHNEILRDRNVRCAENVAYAYHSPQGVFNGWKNS